MKLKSEAGELAVEAMDDVVFVMVEVLGAVGLSPVSAELSPVRDPRGEAGAYRAVASV